MTRQARTLLSSSIVALAACSTRPAPPAAHGALREGEVARVADDRIVADLVADVAVARRVSPKEALTALTDDALLASEARARGLDRGPRGEFLRRTSAARATVRRLLADARAAGPITDAELEALSAMHWREVALPEQVRVIHAVVVRPKRPGPDSDARAKLLAADLERAVRASSSDAEFEQAAKQLPHPGFELTVQRLPAFVLDGRASEGDEGQSFDATFAKAAHALGSPGATSGIVETVFGWHVIRLTERLPAKQLPPDERRAFFGEELFAYRAMLAREAMVQAAKRRTSVDVPDTSTVLLDQILIPSP